MTLKIGWLHEAEQSLGTWLHEADDWQPNEHWIFSSGAPGQKNLELQSCPWLAENAVILSAFLPIDPDSPLAARAFLRKAERLGHAQPRSPTGEGLN
jgi:hypothetical protein